MVSHHESRAPRPVYYVHEHREYNAPWQVRIDTAGENRRLRPVSLFDGLVLWATINRLPSYKSNDNCQWLLTKSNLRD